MESIMLSKSTNKHRVLFITLVDISLIITTIILGYLFGGLLDLDNLAPHQSDISGSTIFFHNLTVSIAIIIFTSIIAYPVIIVNSFFLGLSLNIGIDIFGFLYVLNIMAYHVPIEILGWLLSLNIARKVLDLYKRRKKIQLKQVLKQTLYLAGVYLIAAYIERITFILFG
ncbi:Stage II sporulation protein M [Pelagirhabdus alkalitolerans]|uniref:Stage II sporulation protein M n=1 Tax=Pelagirhabdus alkalitolerans TaxID=1612202 RepID=A0A1G6M5B6_9BACI|nr:stage II sporulation protein M [Pelagirhabdus alkalitolerans]SDC50155.1 Stage II sporulation protein M [Pelagirhabdus alkalitolerans]